MPKADKLQKVKSVLHADLSFFRALEDVCLGTYRRLEIEMKGGDNLQYRVSIYRCTDKLIRADFKKLS